MTMDPTVTDDKFIVGLCNLCSVVAANDDPTTINWDNLRQYVKTISPRRRFAADHQEKNHRRCSDEGVVARLQRSTPLHGICTKDPPTDVVATLVEAFGKETSLELLDANGKTPLHCALESPWPVSIELFRILCLPQITNVTDSQTKSTPLHLLCRNKKMISEECVSHLLVEGKKQQQHCDAVSTARDGLGRTPLHWILSNADHPSSSKVVALLLRESLQSSQMKDVEQKLPLHCLLARAGELSGIGRTGGNEDRCYKYASACFDEYMHMVKKTKKHDADFFITLDRFPAWLKNHAVLNKDVQEMLYRALADPFCFAFFLLDVYNFVAAICCLGLIASSSSFKTDIIASNLLFSSGVYFFIREATYVFLLLLKGRIMKFFRRDIVDQTNAIMAMMLVPLSLVVVFGSKETSKGFHIWLALAAGLAWLGVISLLRRLSMTFTLFWASINAVLSQIIMFVITLVLVMLSFAQMLYIVTVGSVDCKDDPLEEKNAFCTLKGSLLRVYTMSVGEVQESDFYHSPAATALYVWYLFTVVILLANILAYVVGSHVVNTEHETLYFWLNQLDFIVALEEASSSGPFYFLRKCASYEGDLFKKEYELLISLFEGDDKLSLINNCKVKLLQILTIFLIAPIWFALGAVTLGYLWPREVREWLFRRPAQEKRTPTTELTADSPPKNLEASLASIEHEMKRFDSRLHSVEEKLDTLLEMLSSKKAS